MISSMHSETAQPAIPRDDRRAGRLPLSPPARCRRTTRVVDAPRDCCRRTTRLLSAQPQASAHGRLPDLNHQHHVTATGTRDHCSRRVHRQQSRRPRRGRPAPSRVTGAASSKRTRPATRPQPPAPRDRYRHPRPLQPSRPPTAVAPVPRRGRRRLRECDRPSLAQAHAAGYPASASSTTRPLSAPATGVAVASTDSGRVDRLPLREARSVIRFPARSGANPR